MKKYSQLTGVQRYQIEALKKAKKDQKEIAMIIGVSASTISRELKRNTGQRGYRAKQAHIIRHSPEKKKREPLPI